MDLDFIRNLTEPADTKIVFLIMDGVGGLPIEQGGPTELECAKTPNLDKLAAEGICGLHQPVGAGITPGSGPSHLAVFGYDPIKYQVGRGVLAAGGIDFDLQPSDVAARGNFCTVDQAGRVTDRRAGRISTETNQQLCEMLREIKLPGVEVFVETVKEHRFLLVLRGHELSGKLEDTDPQQTGKKPLHAKALASDADGTARLVDKFVDEAGRVLSDQHPANMVLLRGFAQCPQWPTFKDVFGLNAAAIAGYPMYRGLAKLLGMKPLATGAGLEDQFKTLADNFNDFDFFYFHVKHTDSAGEDGDYERKVRVIEETDAQIPKLTELKPDVVVVTGDHSTPALLKYHSWHPVPTLLWSNCCRTDSVQTFGEKACMNGGLGPRIAAVDLVPIALANAGRMEKFGA